MTNLPASVRDTGLISGPWRSHIPRSNQARAPQLLSLCSRAWQPQLLKPAGLEPMLQNKRSRRNEKPAHCNESTATSTTTRQKPVQQQRLCTAKNKSINKTIKKKKTQGATPFNLFLYLETCLLCACWWETGPTCHGGSPKGLLLLTQRENKA